MYQPVAGFHLFESVEHAEGGRGIYESHRRGVGVEPVGYFEQVGGLCDLVLRPRPGLGGKAHEGARARAFSVGAEGDYFAYALAAGYCGQGPEPAVRTAYHAEVGGVDDGSHELDDGFAPFGVGNFHCFGVHHFGGIAVGLVYCCYAFHFCLY